MFKDEFDVLTKIKDSATRADLLCEMANGCCLPMNEVWCYNAIAEICGFNNNTFIEGQLTQEEIDYGQKNYYHNIEGGLFTKDIPRFCEERKNLKRQLEIKLERM